MSTSHERFRFLLVACLFEGALAGVAFALGWLADVDPAASLGWTAYHAALGTAAALPIFILFTMAFESRAEPIERIRRTLMELLGPPFAACRWYHLLLLAAFAGVGEELLFRGLLQPWIESAAGYGAGLVLSNVLFGLAHAVTITYAIAAGTIGLYLGWLLDAAGSRSLLIPIATHTVYDFLAFMVVAAAYRRARAIGDYAEDDRPAETDDAPSATIPFRRDADGPTVAGVPPTSAEAADRPRTHVVAEGGGPRIVAAQPLVARPSEPPYHR